MNFKSLMLIAALAGTAPWGVMAATDAASAATAPTSSAYADGEVKKVDIEQGKLTLKHGPIENLGMPGMTMVFRADPSMLSGVKVGDQVKFKADRVDGAIKVVELTK